MHAFRFVSYIVIEYIPKLLYREQNVSFKIECSLLFIFQNTIYRPKIICSRYTTILQYIFCIHVIHRHLNYNLCSISIKLYGCKYELMYSVYEEIKMIYQILYLHTVNENFIFCCACGATKRDMFFFKLVRIEIREVCKQKHVISMTVVFNSVD